MTSFNAFVLHTDGSAQRLVPTSGGKACWLHTIRQALGVQHVETRPSGDGISVWCAARPGGPPNQPAALLLDALEDDAGSPPAGDCVVVAAAEDGSLNFPPRLLRALDQVAQRL